MGLRRREAASCCNRPAALYLTNSQTLIFHIAKVGMHPIINDVSYFKIVALFPFSIFEIMVYFTIDGVLGSTKYCISRSPAHHVKTPYPFPKDILQAQRSIAAVGGEVTKTRRDPNTARERNDLPTQLP